MKILAYCKKGSSPGFHRIICPLLTMPDVDVFITNDLREEHFQDVDVFMYNRVIGDEHLVKINELKQKIGFKICVDIDDYWELDEFHILYELYQEERFAQRQVHHLRNADLVFCTHERLMEEVLPYNQNVHVLPNAIPKMGQFVQHRTPSEFVRIFWQGSDTHKEDIRLLERPIECLGKISKGIQMVMAGFVNGHQDWYDMARWFTADLKTQYKFIQPVSVDKYYKAYKEADICLIPLVNSKFNRMKSNLKVLEAANMGLPVIASDVHPYKDLPINYCKNSGDWVHQIKRLVRWKNRRVEEGHKLREYCDLHFNFESINTERKQILEHVISIA